MHREESRLAQGCQAREWQSWNSNSGNLTVQPELKKKQKLNCLNYEIRQAHKST